jgi:excinuclease ABC subunit C
VNKHFQLRTCSDAELASRRRPCLQYQIKRCPAPCVIDIDKAWYAEQVRSVALFLEGRHDELSGELTTRMRDASRDMEFELAAIYRDQLRAVEAVREGQRVVAMKDVDQDVIGLYREGSLVEILVLEVRSGRVTDTVSFSLRAVELPDDEVLAGFLNQYYAGQERMAAVIPDEILVSILPDGAEGVAEWLGDIRGKKVLLFVPQRGSKVDLLAMATENAAHSFREKQRGGDDIESRLEELRDRLRLPSLPRRIECCDISHLGGGDTVGSIVSLLDGQLDKKHYRSFKVKTVNDGDDYAAMYEVLGRRFRRGRTARIEAAATEAAASVALALAVATEAAAAAEATAAEADAASEDADLDDVPIAVPESDREPMVEEKTTTKGGQEWDLPDLFVVDGGRGQLNVALQAAHDLGLHDLPIVGLAKERETVSGEKMVDRVYLPGQKNGIPLRSTSTALFFLSRARDEAHRFANHMRKKLGKARRLRSDIDDVPGIGAPVKKALLRELGSMLAIREATDEKILAVTGVTKRHLTALRKTIPAPEKA